MSARFVQRALAQRLDFRAQPVFDLRVEASVIQNRLERPPEASARQVSALVLDILQGQIRIPGWQRRLKWDLEDAKKLIDSIYRGYPIGTLLLWKREARAERLHFGTVSVDAPEQTDALYVVDGQQRLTTLVRVLAGASYPDEDFALCFDLQSGEVVDPSDAVQGPENRWLPLNEALDSRKLMRWLMDHPGADTDLALDFGSRLREYSVPLYTVSGSDERAVREVFERTNDTGKRLDANEIFDGRFRSLGVAKPAGIRDVAEHISAMGFGRLEPEELHTMMLAMHFSDPTKGSTKDWDEARASRALGDLQDAAGRVVDFLRRDADIPHRRLLPYAQPLLTLSRFFHVFPRPHPWNRQSLACWLWRGAAAGLHGGSTIGIRASLLAIPLEDERSVQVREDASVQELLAQVEQGKGRPFDPRADRYNSNWATGRICNVALAALGPRDLETGQEVEAESLASQQIAPGAKLRSSLGNRVLHPRVDGGIRGAIVRCTDDATLASHAIEPDAVDLLARSPSEFISARATYLVDYVTRFVEERVQWARANRPPLDSLWDEDGDS